MIFKFLAIAAVLFLVYIVFFKKNREASMRDKDKSGKYDEITDTLVECPKCGTFASKDESILSNGKYYCSKECLK
ncbi:MAG: PP0621 family protein [Campylobacterota bacterium]|nr:PP0621 family protein [Campylobacterota bacterium]